MQIKWTELIELTDKGVSRIREIAGVYRLSYYDRATQKYYVYYIGQAENLNTRLSEHLEGNEENECCEKHLQRYSCYFRVAAVARQADRDSIEVALYNHFNPSCTEKIPDVQPADVNFE